MLLTECGDWVYTGSEFHTHNSIKRKQSTYLYLIDQRIVKFEARNSFFTAHHTNILSVLAVSDAPAIGGASCQGRLFASAVDIIQPDGACGEWRKGSILSMQIQMARALMPYMECPWIVAGVCSYQLVFIVWGCPSHRRSLVSPCLDRQLVWPEEVVVWVQLGQKSFNPGGCVVCQLPFSVLW